MTNISDMTAVDLTDPELATEIELLAELIVVASESDGSLDDRTIDLVLGVRPQAHAARVPRQRHTAHRAS